MQDENVAPSERNDARFTLESHRPPREGVLLGLQYLRFVAALLVVLSHTWQMVPVVGTGRFGSSFNGGAAGVDLFFVISGFIMVHITRQNPPTPKRFIIDRIARIAPPYWCITLFLAGILIFFPSLFRSAAFDVPSLITSLLFIPWPSNSIEGAAPLLSVGWTLNYEMLFYAIFAISLAISAHFRVAIACGFIIALLSLQLIFSNENSDIFSFYSDTIMIEFVFGMIIGLFVKNFNLSSSVILGFLAASALAFFYSLSFDMGRLSMTRFLVWGIPAAFVVTAVTLCDFKLNVPRSKAMLLLGNASYALYLTHLFPLGAVRFIWPKLPEFIRSSDALLIASSVGAALFVGVAFYFLVEKPLVAVGKRVTAHISESTATRQANKASAES